MAGMTGGRKAALVLLVAGVAGAMTNPDAGRHREALKVRLRDSMQASLRASSGEGRDSSGWALAGQALGMLLGGTIVDRLVDTLVGSRDYVVFSTTTVTMDGETKVIGVGAFGRVVFAPGLEAKLTEQLRAQLTR